MVGTALEELPVPARPHTRSGSSPTRTVLAAAAVLIGIASGAAAARWYFAERPTAVETPAPRAAAPELRTSPMPVIEPAPALPVEPEPSEALPT